jgi:hypothetical protein
MVWACASADAGQLTDGATRTKYLNCGGFTVKGGDTVLVHASLDDNSDARPARATLQLYDETGTLRGNKEALLQPGQTTTLVITAVTSGVSVYRAHVEFREAALAVSARRAGIALVEILDLAAETKPVCVLIDNGLRPQPQ